MRDGTYDGVCRQWNDQGELLGSYEMTGGTGTVKKWYENGYLEWEISYVNGMQSGRIRMWSEQGDLIIEGFMLDSRRVSRTKYLDACKVDLSLPHYEEIED